MKFCRLTLLMFLLLTSAVSLLGQSNPIPTIDGPVSPQAVVPGSAGFTLTVRGANFVPGAVVNWNGSARSTTYVSASELQAQIPASDVTLAGSALITVTNPSPGGGASSSSFGIAEVHQPIASIMLTQPKGYAGTGGSLFTADLNGDNKQDLVEAGFGFTVLLGNGDGTFTKSSSLSLANIPAGLSFGDFNADGKEDFAVTIYERGVAFVALGDGTGKFHLLPGFGSFSMPVQTASGDFNRDGKLDLAVADSNGVYILLGNGDGTFQPQQLLSSVPSANALIAADFSGDGVLDLTFAEGGTGVIAVLLGNGDGTFQPMVETQLGDYIPSSSLVGDLNGDGKLDYIVLGGGTPIPVGVALGNGDGSFQSPKYYSTGFTGQFPLLTVGDFNSDGSSDVFSYGMNGFLAGFLAGNGDGTLQRVARLTVPGAMSKGPAVVGDFNSDGLLDFATIAHVGVKVFLQAPQ
jgi:hypothetical protein